MAGFIPWSTVDLRLRATRTIWIATTRPDGRPHAVPVWFWWDGAALYFVSERTLQKARNLARQPWLVAHAGDGDDAVILEGPTAVVSDEADRRRVDAAYGDKYVDPGIGARATVVADGVDLYRVRVRRVMAWAYGRVGNRTDWRFDG